MAPPTSVSSSSCTYETRDIEKTSAEPPSEAEETTKVISATTISATPGPEALEFLSLLSGSYDAAHATYAAVAQRDFTASLCEINRSVDYPDVTYAARKENKGDMVVSIPFSSVMTTTLSNSSTDAAKENSSLSFVGCKVTAAHQESKMTTVMYSLPLSPEEAKVEMCHKDVVAVPTSSGGNLRHSENDADLQKEKPGSLKQSFVDNHSSSSWSTSTETNFDCENGSCDGTEMKCRLCGKIVPKLQKSGITSLERECQNIGINSALCKGSFLKSFSASGENRKHNHGGRLMQPKLPGAVPSFRKHIGPRYFSALLSSSNRTIKKKGNRRSSVDVLFGREPTEPDIVKIKAKRRLSRQHDVSSIELMTLTEGNENDDSSSKSKDTNNPEEFSSSKITFHQIPVSISRHCRATSCRELLAESSTDSCPRAPWNSLETNPSSQDLDDRFVNDTGCTVDCNFMEGPLGEEEEEICYHQEDDSEGLETSEKAAENDGRKDAVEEDGEVDAEEPSEDEHPVSARPMRKKEKRSLKGKKKKKINYDKIKRNVRPDVMDLGNWTTELLIMLALLVYMACKALKFVETFFLAPQKKKKKKKK